MNFLIEATTQPTTNQVILELGSGVIVLLIVVAVLYFWYKAG